MFFVLAVCLYWFSSKYFPTKAFNLLSKQSPKSQYHIPAYISKALNWGALLNCGLGHVTGVVVTPLVWVISLWKPTALWSVLPSHKPASHICQSDFPPATPFPLKVNTTVSPHIYLRAHRHPYKTCMQASMRAYTDTVPIMVTNPAWAGFHLWVMAWCVVRVKLPRHLPFTDGSAGCPRALSGGHDCRPVLDSNLPWSGWRTDT